MFTVPRAPKNDLAGLARTARAQLRRAELLGQSLDERLKAARENHPGWQPDEEWRKDFNQVTQTIAQSGQALQRALEANEKKLAGMTVEQLEAQLRAELARIAPHLTAEEWAMLDNIRLKLMMQR